MERKQPLLPDLYYHIYNRGNNGDDIFIEERNYSYFLSLWDKHVEPISETFAYCLLKNYFHFLVRIKSNTIVENLINQKKSKKSIPDFCSQQLSNCFNAYAKAINKAYHRSGSLFENRFERKTVKNKKYLLNLIVYIHQNPQQHGFIEDYRYWSHSSYKSHLSEKQSKLQREDVHVLFGSRDDFIRKQSSKIKLDLELENLVVEKVVVS